MHDACKSQRTRAVDDIDSRLTMVWTANPWPSEISQNHDTYDIA